jgi:hypothetical protein
MTNPNEPAMPVEARTPFYHNGLTKREYMATKLMAAMMSHDNEAWAGVTYDEYAHEAVKATASLIKRLNSEEQS